MDLNQPVLIAENLWWVGLESTHQNLQCNPYLLIDQGQGILFDPGSVLDGETVLRKVTSLIPLNNLEAIVLSHQDPDLCSAIPLFEQAGFSGVLCCHERAAMLIQYYKVKSPFYLVNHHNFSYTMQSGASIGFLFTPYLHFPGSIMSYLPKQQALISGDIFGSISADWKLYADETYLDGMKAFHEVYMPSHAILESAMNLLESYPINLICPQHGSIIQENIPLYRETLKQLPCGLFLDQPQALTAVVIPIPLLLDKVIKRLITINGSQSIQVLFEHSPFTINIRKQSLVKTTIPDEELWEAFFSYVEEKGGISYLSSIATMVEGLCKEHRLILPKPFTTVLFYTQKQLHEQQMELDGVQKQLKEMEESVYRDPVTHLHNKDFFTVLLHKHLQEIAKGTETLALLLLSINNLELINLDYGSSEGDNTLKLLSSVLQRVVQPTVQVCRYAGGIFALLCNNADKEEMEHRATTLQNLIAEEERFIVPITVSMGLFHSAEIPQKLYDDPDQMAGLVTQTALYRLRLATKQGVGIVSDSKSMQQTSQAMVTILLVDNPGFVRDAFAEALRKEQYQVLVADDGLQAKNILLATLVNIILSELMIPKLSGLTLRKELLKTPSLGKIPFLLMSINRQERTVRRAYELGIQHFLARPVAMYDIVGLIGSLYKKGV